MMFKLNSDGKRGPKPKNPNQKDIPAGVYFPGVL